MSVEFKYIPEISKMFQDVCFGLYMSLMCHLQDSTDGEPFTASEFAIFEATGLTVEQQRSARDKAIALGLLVFRVEVNDLHVPSHQYEIKYHQVMWMAYGYPEG